jgi:hypothetical protein
MLKKPSALPLPAFTLKKVTFGFWNRLVISCSVAEPGAVQTGVPPTYLILPVSDGTLVGLVGLVGLVSSVGLERLVGLR